MKVNFKITWNADYCVFNVEVSLQDHPALLLMSNVNFKELVEGLTFLVDIDAPTTRPSEIYCPEKFCEMLMSIAKLDENNTMYECTEYFSDEEEVIVPHLKECLTKRLIAKFNPSVING